MKQEKRIRKLSEESRLLKKKLNRLRMQQAASKVSISPVSNKNENVYELMLYEASSRRRLFTRSTSYAAYLIGSLKTNSLFIYYKRVVYAIRKYAFFTTTLKILAFVFALVQSSALFVIVTGSLAVTVPFTVLFSYIAILISFFFKKKQTKNIRSMLCGNENNSKPKNAVVFFPPKGRAFESTSYFKQTVSYFGNKKDTVAIIVSPYYFSSKGYSNKKNYYSSLRYECKNVIIIRKHYYFTLYKNVLKNISDRTIYIF